MFLISKKNIIQAEFQDFYFWFKNFFLTYFRPSDTFFLVLNGRLCAGTCALDRLSLGTTKHDHERQLHVWLRQPKQQII